MTKEWVFAPFLIFFSCSDNGYQQHSQTNLQVQKNGGIVMNDVNVSKQLIGTWKLKILEDFDGSKWVRTFGDHPAGYFSFDGSGRVSVQFQKDATKIFSNSNEPTPEEALNAYNGYLAYFGSYSVDAKAGTFTSVVEGSLNPALIGTKQIRKFEIKGREMIVGDQVTYRRYFEKQ
jgi:Lipocalin-like domain